MAKNHPSAHVCGMDITLPVISGQPNLTLVDSDADKAWPFKNQFMFIHGRMLTSGVHNWPGFLSEAWRCLRPGGQLELLDVTHPYRADDPSCDNESSAFIRWGHAAEKSWIGNGLDYRSAAKHEHRLQQLGFRNIRQTTRKWPLGEWSDNVRDQQIGRLTLQNFEAFLKTAGNKILTGHPDINEEDAAKLSEQALEDLGHNCASKRLYLSMQVPDLS